MVHWQAQWYSEMASEKACNGNMWEKTGKAAYSREIGSTILAAVSPSKHSFAMRILNKVR